MKAIYLNIFFCFTAFAGITQSVTYNYTGGVQNYVVPAGVTGICLDVRGAQGNANTAGLALGGLGGRVQGIMPVVAGQVLQIYVGGGGSASSVAGYNGGGRGGNAGCAAAFGGGGGGASDVRITPYALANRVAVGGGGTGGNRTTGCSPGSGGGGGGGYYGGGGGGAYGGMPGTGGTQVAGGTGGIAGAGCPGPPTAGLNGVLGTGGAGGDVPGNNQAGPNPGCAGGAGGALTGGTGPNCTGGTGCPSTWAGASGGGGSNYAAGTLAGVVHTQGFQTGNGQVIITPNTCPILPIVLADFNAEFNKENRSVLLKWSTESEKNNKLFSIEKSVDLTEWKVVSNISGAGNSYQKLHYEGRDIHPYSGTSYYRIKQTDFNGEFTFSTALPIYVIDEPEFTISPNPTSGNIGLLINSALYENAVVTITTLTGQEIMQFVFEPNNEDTLFHEVNTSDLPPGVYFIKLDTSGKSCTKKLIKE